MLTTAQPIAPSTRIVLVRHGRSTFNEQGRYQGSSDESALTEQGQETARQVGVFLNGLSIDAIYASPLKRVQQTVNAICSTMQQDIQSIPTYQTWQLREIDLLSWEGLSFQLVQQQFADAYRCWKQRPHEFQLPVTPTTPNSGQPIAVPSSCFPVLELYDRAQQFWQTVLSQHSGQTLLIVSHGGMNHALISTALGLSTAHHHTLQQSNCGVSGLEFTAGALKQSTLRSLNLTHHLGETLPKLKEGKQGLRLLLVPTDLEFKQSRSLGEHLKTTPIHFCLSSRFHPAHETVNTLLYYHPTAVQLQTSHWDFADLWQQTLSGRRTDSPNLITGLVVAYPETIQRLLAQVNGLDPTHLSIQQGTISVLHYPSIAQRPVLQALNWGGAIFPADRAAPCPILGLSATG
jgi:phosphoserine phosphatase